MYGSQFFEKVGGIMFIIWIVFGSVANWWSRKKFMAQMVEELLVMPSKGSNDISPSNSAPKEEE